MQFVEDLEEKSAEIFDELPGDFSRQDKKEGKNEMIWNLYNDQHYIIGTNNL